MGIQMLVLEVLMLAVFSFSVYGHENFVPADCRKISDEERIKFYEHWEEARAQPSTWIEEFLSGHKNIDIGYSFAGLYPCDCLITSFIGVFKCVESYKKNIPDDYKKKFNKVIAELNQINNRNFSEDNIEALLYEDLELNLTLVLEIRLNGSLKSLEPLTELPITDLVIIDSNITDLSFLPKIKSLKNLYIINAKELTDISPIGKMWWLDELRMKNTIVADFSPLKGCKTLTVLDLSDNSNLTDISWIGSMSDRLQKLIIMNTNVSDLTPLSNMKILRVVNLEGTKVTDISSIPPADMRLLSIVNTKVSDISTIKKMPRLDFFIFTSSTAYYRLLIIHGIIIFALFVVVVAAVIWKRKALLNFCFTSTKVQRKYYPRV